MRAVFVILVGMLWSATAWTLPPDRVIKLEVGKAASELAAKGSWELHSTDPQVLKATYFDTAEVLLEAGEAGSALLLLFNQVIDRFGVWRVQVATPATERVRPPLSAWAAVPGCQAEAYPVTCLIKDANALSQIRALLRGSDLTTGDLRIVYSVGGAQALLKILQEEVKRAGFSGVELALSGANLRVSAKVADAKERMSLLLVLYRHMVGKLVLENRIVLSNPVHPRQQ